VGPPRREASVDRRRFLCARYSTRIRPLDGQGVSRSYARPVHADASCGIPALLAARKEGRIVKIYTKTGDRGDTRLFDGTKVRKYDDRVEAYGAIDELNSFIGASSTFLQDPALKVMLAEIQKDLFSVGAQLADPGFREQSRAKFQLDPGRIAALENAIDRFETELPPLRQFILAGGGHGGALLHVALTVCRRSERR